MSKLTKFVNDETKLKIAITDYIEPELDVIYTPNYYYTKHWVVLKRKKEEKIGIGEFHQRLYNYLWHNKISELILILYLEDLNNNNPTIYELNKLLKRTTNQYSSTFKAVSKLEKLNIVYTKPIKDSNRKEKQVFINKELVTIYGDDEFREMMLEEWDNSAKQYINRKLSWLLKEKEKVKQGIKLIKKGKKGRVLE
jgi:hypothetical protein